jgi:hypothetical protein
MKVTTKKVDQEVDCKNAEQQANHSQQGGSMTTTKKEREVDNDKDGGRWQKRGGKGATMKKEIDEMDGSWPQKRRAASEPQPTRRFNDNHVEGAGERLKEQEVDDDKDGGRWRRRGRRGATTKKKIDEMDGRRRKEEVDEDHKEGAGGQFKSPKKYLAKKGNYVLLFSFAFLSRQKRKSKKSKTNKMGISFFSTSLLN